MAEATTAHQRDNVRNRDGSRYIAVDNATGPYVVHRDEDDAHHVCARIRAADPDWNYQVQPVRGGFAIACRDEAENFLGYL